MSEQPEELGPEDMLMLELEAILEDASREFEAITTAVDDYKSEYSELILERKKLYDRIAEINKRLAEIDENQYKHQREKNQAKRRVDEAEIKLNEQRRIRELAQTRKNFFADLVDECKKADYKWVHYAMKHQWEGALTMAHHSASILGDGTGTGKTITAIMNMDMIKAKKVLVITPSDIVSPFFDAIVMFAPHRNVMPLGNATPTDRKMAAMIAASSSEFTFVTNYESMWRNSEWVTDVEWDAVYIDEAHTFKSAKGLSFNKLSQINTKHVFPMTATSILNSPEDIWTSLNLIAPETFYDRHVFLQSFCRQNDNGKWVFREGGEAAMLRSLGGRIVKRTMEETGIVLPKQTVQEYLIPQAAISVKQAEIMNQLNNFASLQINENESLSIDAIIALITRQRQSVVYPAGIIVKATEKDVEFNPELEVGQVLYQVPMDTPSVIINHAVKRITEQVKAGHRTVVFSQFKGALKELQMYLQMEGLRVARFDGDTKQRERLAIKKDFLRPAKDMPPRESYEYDVVLANYKTGGVGLTFTEATYMLCLDEEWNPAKNKQAWARIDRIGQTEETLVEIMRVEKSISMWMKQLNEHKASIEQGFTAEINMLESFQDYLDEAQIPIKELNELKSESNKEVEEETTEGSLVQSLVEKEQVLSIQEPVRNSFGTPVSVEPEVEVDSDFLELLESMED